MAECGTYFHDLPDAPQGGGAKIDRLGVVWYPSAEPCTYCTERGGGGTCYEAIVPHSTMPGEALNPRTTPLDAFPEWPVEYFVKEEQPDGTVQFVQRRRSRLTSHDRPLNRLLIPLWYSTAVSWLARARSLAIPFGGDRIQWIERLAYELQHFADGATLPCAVNCNRELDRIWLVANAAQYLTRVWGDNDPPPVLDTAKPTDELAAWIKWTIAGVLVAGGGFLIWRLTR